MTPNPLWLALHFPCLPLEANAAQPSPSAVVDNARVVLADEQARAAGVTRGTGVAAARMLAPSITLLARNRSREAATMRTLACWAGAFTPRVSLTPDTLLLEVGGCLRLFGGLEPLAGAVSCGVQAQGFSAALAAAPTPLGAQWLAQAGTASLCRDRDSLRRQLEQLAIDVLPDPVATSLKRFGAQTLADVRRLPGGELARRLGDGCRQLMAQAFGELPDPRADFVFPERFALSLELPASVDHASALLFAARRLCSALSGWLAARQAGVREFCLHLVHRQQETRLLLQFSAPTADPGRFERVLRERLEQLVLAAPVDALRLEAAQLAALPGRSQALFADVSSKQEAISALLERFSARLGEQQVYQLAVRDDHRPECATRHAAPLATLAPAPDIARPRPLWLVAPPQPLAEVDGRPCRRGTLKLLTGPERIESGWWDSGEASGDIRRDYFIALSGDGCWLWIYRDAKLPGGWFLHGFFS
jgi:protein ImuB